MAKVVFSDRARRALLDILSHIAQHNPKAAMDLIHDLEARVGDTIATFPEAGAKWHGGRRFRVVRRHSVVYRYGAAEDEGVVLAVFGPGMDWR